MGRAEGMRVVVVLDDVREPIGHQVVFAIREVELVEVVTRNVAERGMMSAVLGLLDAPTRERRGLCRHVVTFHTVRLAGRPVTGKVPMG